MYRAAILVANGVQDEEFIYPYYRLQEAGFTVKVFRPLNGEQNVKGKYGIPIPVDTTIFDAKEKDFDLVIVPGGWQCPEILRQDAAVLDFVRDMFNAGKVIGAICHGPWVLISAGVVKDRLMTCYKGMKDDLNNAGATYIETNVVQSGNIVTAPHYRNNPEFMREVLRTHEQYMLSNMVLA